ncbi:MULTISPECIES: M35 family metallo-endopeptidase [Xanthomonas]|uniref:M35 family metallopeptidase n=1 Tax=Xanthomonas dyei TaxID=743699 RepID=A0ABZ0D7I7_9XANT|nr:M35 family metallo-endopeptidase [Xanthomonas dyei]MCC4633305.1 M35 family metallopeptidase [Xanthomonas dyei pv. eucalypti]WOB26250.1 M35 family metallopeptidase [Xanthomonas dyei]WOB53872.1 M35 family metallopeptidase [Xanthomonas dyei]
MFVGRYEGFTQEQQLVIGSACNRMQQRADRSLDDGTPIAAWFGAADRNQVLLKLRMMSNVIGDAGRTVTFVNRTGGQLGVTYTDVYTKSLNPVGHGIPLAGSGIVAYVFPVDRRYGEIGPQSTVSHVGSGMRIYINDVFFDIDPVMQSATIYHEITHKVLATNDHCYGAASCRLLATQNPGNAIDNADNFALYLANC